MKTQSILPGTERSYRQPIGRGATWARRVYLGLAVLFWIGIIGQTFLAGAGIFLGGSWMRGHEALGHLLTSPIPLIPLLLLILSFVGRLPGRDRWLCALLLVLAMLQPVVLYLRGVLPLLSTLHPVNALLLFALPMFLIARVRRATHDAALSSAPAALMLCIATAIVLAACGSAAGGSSSASGGGDGAGNTAVHMDNTTFKPPSVTVQSGQSLTLIADTFVPHVIANGRWESAVAKPAREQGAPRVADLKISGNGSKTIGPFTTAGAFQFYCTLHPNMNLAVVVK